MSYDEISYQEQVEFWATCIAENGESTAREMLEAENEFDSANEEQMLGIVTRHTKQYEGEIIDKALPRARAHTGTGQITMMNLLREAATIALWMDAKEYYMENLKGVEQ